MKEKIFKTVFVTFACLIAAGTAVGEVIANYQSEKKMENFESRLAALEKNEES